MYYGNSSLNSRTGFTFFMACMSYVPPSRALMTAICNASLPHTSVHFPNEKRQTYSQPGKMNKIAMNALCT